MPARYEREENPPPRKGMPIGNLTSQIFANVYLNELDRFVKHSIKPQAYLRYGDDFIVISKNLTELKTMREVITKFLREKLYLEINGKHDIIIKSAWGLKFLGVDLFPGGRRLNRRNRLRILSQLKAGNFGSYSGLVRAHDKNKLVKNLDWTILEKLNGEF